jgi:hypothetical protein
MAIEEGQIALLMADVFGRGWSIHKEVIEIK